MKTAISIPDALFDAAEKFAHRMGISRSELFREALKNYLSTHRQEAVTDALNEVFDAEPESSRLDNSLEAAQLQSLPDEDWD